MSWKVLSGVLTGCLLIACGNKGPLVLPEANEPADKELTGSLNQSESTNETLELFGNSKNNGG